jgi:plastocyanin
VRAGLATGALAIAVLALPAPAPAHPGHGPVEIEVGDDFFQPGVRRVATGDTVIWKWSGPAGDHSVTADPGQAESFDSDPGRAPATIAHPAGFAFTHSFGSEGEFTYACRVHPTMRGEIRVVAPPALDVVRPRISDARVRDGVLRFALSERAVVVARIDRLVRGRWRLQRTFDFEARRGSVRRRLRLRGFDPGRYRVRLLAYDDADNSSPLRRAGFRIPRG